MKLILFLLVAISVLMTSNAQVNYDRLMSDLLNGYNRAQPPSHNVSTKVSMGMTLESITKLDEFDGTFSAIVLQNLLWNDPRFAWDPSFYDGITVIRIPATHVWIPDIILYNSVAPWQNIAHVHVLVYSDGTLSYIVPLSIKSSCQMDLSKYPYDVQNCTLIWGSWVHDDESVSLNAARDNVGLESYIVNPYWDLVDTSAVKEVVKYSCCTETYTNIKISFTVKRRHPEGLIASAVIATWMILVVFIVLPSSGERIIFSGFILVSLVYLMASQSTTIPTYAFTRLGRYLVFGMLLTAIVTVVNAVCYSLYPRQELKNMNDVSPSTQDLLNDRRRRNFRLFDLVAMLVTFVLLAIMTGALFAL